VQLLADHPGFSSLKVAASERSFGKKYSEAVIGIKPIPAEAAI